MNLILTHLQHNLGSHLDHHTDTGTNIIGSIIISDKVVIRWWELEMHYIINGDELWIPNTCKADSPNTNLHSNIPPTEWQTEPGQAALPATDQHHPKAAVAIQFEIAVAGPKAAAAAMLIKTPVPVAMGLGSMKMANNGRNPAVMMAVTSTRRVSRGLNVMTMMMNCDPHVEEQAF